MSDRRITGSRLALADACPGSHALPWVGSRSKAADDGTAGHAFLERVGAGDRLGAIEALPEHMRKRCEAIDVVAMVQRFGAARYEVTFAYDPLTDTARELGAGLDRDYSDAKPGEIVATADVIGLDATGDFKFGQGMVLRPRENWQFKLIALANARARGDAFADSWLLKVDEDGNTLEVSDTFDAMDLDGIAAGVRDIYERVVVAQAAVKAGGTPQMVTGEHCRYCPAFASCPAQAGAGQALVALSERSEALTPQRAGEAWVLMRTVKAAVEKMEDVLRAMAEAEPLPLPNGKVLKPVVSQVEVLELEAAIENATPETYSQVLKAGSVTKAALERAIGKDETKALIEQMRKAGGVGYAPRTSLRECKP